MQIILKNPMPMVERRLNMIIARNPQLENSSSRNLNTPFIRKYSHLPYNNQ